MVGKSFLGADWPSGRVALSLTSLSPSFSPVTASLWGSSLMKCAGWDNTGEPKYGALSLAPDGPMARVLVFCYEIVDGQQSWFNLRRTPSQMLAKESISSTPGSPSWSEVRSLIQVCPARFESQSLRLSFQFQGLSTRPNLAIYPNLASCQRGPQSFFDYVMVLPRDLKNYKEDIPDERSRRRLSSLPPRAVQICG